jgi:hypothetical protein
MRSFVFGLGESDAGVSRFRGARGTRGSTHEAAFQATHEDASKPCCTSPDKCIIVNCYTARLGTRGLTVTNADGKCQYERRICTNPGEECNASTGKCEVAVCN